MKIQIKTLIIALGLVNFSETFGGDHYVEKDEFSGKIYKAFAQTDEEISKAGFYMSLASYNEKKKTIEVRITTPIGVDCKKKGLEIKTEEGKIHHISAGEANMNFCLATIPLDWTKKNMTVRVPMRVSQSLVGTINTEKLKPELYK